MKLAELGNIPIDFAVIKSLYPEYRSVHNKVSELEKSGALIRLKKGLYVVARKESGELINTELIANHLYGPSYVSMESALRFHGIIPEQVHTIRSLTTKHSRTFVNSLGKFEYLQCTKEYFPIGIQQILTENKAYLIASPEKALCDLILHTPNLNLRFQKDIRLYLEEDLRLDMDAFYQMDSRIPELCMQAGKKKNALMNLLKVMKR